jgi:hypothetical protein
MNEYLLQLTGDNGAYNLPAVNKMIRFAGDALP